MLLTQTSSCLCTICRKRRPSASERPQQPPHALSWSGWFSVRPGCPILARSRKLGLAFQRSLGSSSFDALNSLIRIVISATLGYVYVFLLFFCLRVLSPSIKENVT